MSIVILIPALVSALALCFWAPAKVFRNITLPIVLLCPLIYLWKVPLLPPINFAESALLPLGIAMAIRSLRRWRFSVIDLWMLLFLVSACWHEHSAGHQTVSIFNLFHALCAAFIPYMAGKLLIEQDEGRIATMRRIVALLLAAAVIGFYEFFARANLFKIVFDRFFTDDPQFWETQFRSGRPRITGPFWQAELAGTMLMIGILLVVWLAKYGNWAGRFRNAGWIPFRKSTAILALLLLALALTQSRGPELGLFFGLPIALIGRSRRVLRATLIALLFLTVGGAVTYSAIIRYAATNAPASEEQQTAQYRAIMIKNYLPMAEQSGPWGLGTDFPRIGIQESIDNEYLFLALTQGWVGLGSFLLLSLGTIYCLVWAALYNLERPDRALGFTLLGIFLAFLLILATVFLGLQPHLFFFLIVGWAQAVRQPRKPETSSLFQRIYT